MLKPAIYNNYNKFCDERLFNLIESLQPRPIDRKDYDEYTEPVGYDGSAGPEDAGKEGEEIVTGRIGEWYQETTPLTSPNSYEEAARGGFDDGASCRAAQILQT